MREVGDMSRNAARPVSPQLATGIRVLSTVTAQSCSVYQNRKTEVISREPKTVVSMGFDIAGKRSFGVDFDNRSNISRDFCRALINWCALLSSEPAVCVCWLIAVSVWSLYSQTALWIVIGTECWWCSVYDQWLLLVVAALLLLLDP